MTEKATEDRRQTVGKWTQAEAIELCKLIEAIAPRHGAHVALTGGLLYKEGERKDCDLLFYCIRQVDEIGRVELCAALEDMGMEMGASRGWVKKATWRGKSVDMFFPEAFPSSSMASDPGTY